MKEGGFSRHKQLHVEKKRFEFTSPIDVCYMSPIAEASGSNMMECY